MRTITANSAAALRAMRRFSGGNTSVTVEDRFIGDKAVKVAVMRLHGNEIALFDGQLLTVSDCGWQTNTTKERLNGIFNVFGIEGGISQKDWQWYFVAGYWTNTPTDDNPWNGYYTETRRERWDGMRKQWPIFGY